MKIKRELFKIIFFIILININSNVFAITKNTIIANVDNQIVSSYELKNKVKTILFLANQIVDQTNVNLVKQKALQQLIDYKLKKDQVLKFGIQLNNTAQVDNHIKKISSLILI